MASASTRSTITPAFVRLDLRERNANTQSTTVLLSRVRTEELAQVSLKTFFNKTGLRPVSRTVLGQVLKWGYRPGHWQGMVRKVIVIIMAFMTDRQTSGSGWMDGWMGGWKPKLV